jgi:hypothetical protein
MKSIIYGSNVKTALNIIVDALTVHCQWLSWSEEMIPVDFG